MAASQVAFARRLLAALGPLQAAVEIRTLNQCIGRTVATPRFTAALTAASAVVSRLLAAIGLCGVMAYSVAQRRRELGIRMALGARPSAVRGLVVAEALQLGGAGLAIGLAGAVAATRLLGALLSGVSAMDPLTFAGVALLLALVLVAAAYVPARRATLVDPVLALRAD